MREPRRRQQAAAAARNNVAPAARSTNLMDMPLDEFQGALAELAQQGSVDTDALLRQYRSANSPFAAVNRAAEGAAADLAAAGRRPVAGSAGLLSRPIDGAGGVGLNLGGGLLGMLSGAGRQFDAPMAAYQELIPAEDMNLEALGTGSMAMLGGGAVTVPRGSLRAGFARETKDASDIFGEGTQRVTYRDPESGGMIEVLQRPNGNASVLELQVPEEFRGRGIGQSLQSAAMAENPRLMGQVSSKAAATTAYRLGRRPYGQPDASLDDVFRMMDEDSSVNLLTPDAQPSAPAANTANNGGLLAPADTVADAPPQPARDLTERESMAALILDMRASGNARSVTDDMMAQADPQYMYANTPLPMDAASRLARAGEVGAYHGTTANFPAFDGRAYSSSGFGTHMGDKLAADAILRARRSPYLPKDAPAYVEGSQVLPLRVNAGPMLRVEDTETWNPGATQYAMAWSDDPAAVDAYNRIENNPDYPKFGTEAEQSAFMQNDFEKSGFGGFVYDNKFEGGGDSYAVFNPQNIRSRFARFDPEFAHLSNLNAANIDPLSGLFGAMAAEEQRRQRNAP